MKEIGKKPQIFIEITRSDLKKIITIIILAIALIAICIPLYNKMQERYEAQLEAQKLVRELLNSV